MEIITIVQGIIEISTENWRVSSVAQNNDMGLELIWQ
jgi:hypothetical protein